MQLTLVLILMLALTLPARASEPALRVGSGVQQKDGSSTASLVVTLFADAPEVATIRITIPPGWDVRSRSASTGALGDDSGPPGTPPSIVVWRGDVGPDAPVLIQVSLLALPYARPGWASVDVLASDDRSNVVSDRAWVRAPGEVTKPPLRRLWLPLIRR